MPRFVLCAAVTRSTGLALRGQSPPPPSPPRQLTDPAACMPPYQCRAALGRHLAQAVADAGRGRVLHIAHSGGALLTYLAAQYHLTPRYVPAAGGLGVILRRCFAVRGASAVFREGIGVNGVQGGILPRRACRSPKVWFE